jgi:hypothetical protein
MSYNNRIRIINFAASKNHVVKSTFTSTLDIWQEDTQSNWSHFDRQGMALIVFNVRSFSGMDSDHAHYLVAAKHTER